MYEYLQSGKRYRVTLHAGEGELTGQFVQLREAEPEDPLPDLCFTFGWVSVSIIEKIEEA